MGIWLGLLSDDGALSMLVECIDDGIHIEKGCSWCGSLLLVIRFVRYYCPLITIIADSRSQSAKLPQSLSEYKFHLDDDQHTVSVLDSNSKACLRLERASSQSEYRPVRH